MGLGLLALACATGQNASPPDARVVVEIDATPPPVVDAAPPDAMGAIASSCPPDQFATGFDGNGLLECAPIDATALAAVEQHCTVYQGWRDSCDGCTNAPSKWGRAMGETCSNGAGGNNTCTTGSLGGVSVRLIGINTDGNVNDDDKFHVGFHCEAPADDPAPGPCADGSFMAGTGVKGELCVTARAAIASYVRDQCLVYYGWRDSCNSCTSVPSKWGHVNTTSCSAEVGGNNTCNSPSLGGQAVRLLGVNTDGDVDGDDKFYFGFQCNGAVESSGPVPTTCPAGELMTAIESDGTVQCASPLPAAQTAVRSGCFLYAGWRDSCDGCTNAPSKWGRVSHNTCENGVGGDNTCVSSPLDGASIPLFGLNTDGDVNDDDKFYLGMRCL